MHLFHRQAKECSAGSQWYTCTSSSFTGCCSVDPCANNACPDSIKPSTTVTLELQVATTVTGVLPIITASSAKMTSSITGSASNPTKAPTTGSSASVTGKVSLPTSVGESASKSSTVESKQPAESGISSGSSSPSSNKGMIAGVVVGLLAVAIILIVGYMCIRRRRKSRKQRELQSKSPFMESNLSIIEKTMPGGHNDLPRIQLPEQVETPATQAQAEQSVQEERQDYADVFAPFGGYHNPPATLCPPRRPLSARTQRTLYTLSQYSTPDEPQEPDVEKTALPLPPPLTDHPALHPLPGQSPRAPAYERGAPPIDQGTIQQLHPAFMARHPSIVEEHPALRSSFQSVNSEVMPPPTYQKSHPRFTLHSGLSIKPSVLSNSPRASLASQKRARSKSSAAISSKSSIRVSPDPRYLQFEDSPTLLTDPFTPRGSVQSVVASRSSRRLLKHASLPAIPPTPTVASELPTAMPAELGGDDPNFRMVSRGGSTNTVATKASTYSIPIGLGDMSTPLDNNLEPVRERNSMSEAALSPPLMSQNVTIRNTIYPGCLASPGHLMSPGCVASPLSCHPSSSRPITPQMFSPDLYTATPAQRSPDIRSPHYKPELSGSKSTPTTFIPQFASYPLPLNAPPVPFKNYSVPQLPRPKTICAPPLPIQTAVHDPMPTFIAATPVECEATPKFQVEPSPETREKLVQKSTEITPNRKSSKAKSKSKRNPLNRHTAPAPLDISAINPADFLAPPLPSPHSGTPSPGQQNNRRQKARSTIGKGKEHVMAWATYSGRASKFPHRDDSRLSFLSRGSVYSCAADDADVEPEPELSHGTGQSSTSESDEAEDRAPVSGPKVKSDYRTSPPRTEQPEEEENIYDATPEMVQVASSDTRLLLAPAQPKQRRDRGSRWSDFSISTCLTSPGLASPSVYSKQLPPAPPAESSEATQKLPLNPEQQQQHASPAHAHPHYAKDGKLREDNNFHSARRIPSVGLGVASGEAYRNTWIESEGFWMREKIPDNEC